MGKRGPKLREFCAKGHKIEIDYRGKRFCRMCHNARTLALAKTKIRKPESIARKNTRKLTGQVTMIFLSLQSKK